MTGTTRPAAAEVVGPSRLVTVVMAPGTRMLNPAGARLAGDMFVIPLTFGNQSDWSRNVRAAGGCSIRLNGVNCQAGHPQAADRTQAGGNSSVRRSARWSGPRSGYSVSGSSCCSSAPEARPADRGKNGWPAWSTSGLACGVHRGRRGSRGGTPTASVPDPEAPYAVHPVPVGRYRGLISHVSAEVFPEPGKPSRMGPGWHRAANLYVPLPAGGGQMRDLVVGAQGLPDSALIKVVAGGLSS